MIIVMKKGATGRQIEAVENKLTGYGFKIHKIEGDIKTVIGAIGDKRQLNMNSLLTMHGVEDIIPIMKPYKLAGNEVIKSPTEIKVRDITIGGREVTVMAGPCAIESYEQLSKIAKSVKSSGAKILRGGAFKPRSSPYSFQGLEDEGLKIMYQVGKECDMPIVTEVVDPRDVEYVSKYADILQIGARNMQNFRLLQEVGMTKKPVLLKRGLSATVEDLLMSAEYIMNEGNENVILCERGIRTFERITRNTLDISAVPVIKSISHLPVLIDPSHASGVAKLVPSLARAAVAAGADGLIIEVHNDPEHALCDGDQSITPYDFSQLMDSLRKIAAAMEVGI